MERIHAQLDAGEPVHVLDPGSEAQPLLSDLGLLTMKPTLYIANVAEDGFEDNPLLNEVAALGRDKGVPVVPVCAAVEAELGELDDAERHEFLADMGLHEPGLNRLIRAGYALLGLQTFFTTTGRKEVRAWTIPVGTTALEAAGKIHTDFQRGFIRAEVIAYDDFIEHRGEHGAKETGKLRLEGKDYVVKDGDVIKFRFSV